MPRLTYEAVYIPSDIRWSYELQEVGNIPFENARHSELAQRGFVALSSIVALVDLFATIIGSDTHAERQLALALFDAWHLDPSGATFAAIRLKCENLAASLRGAVNRGEPERISHYLDRLPDALLGHAVDCPMLGCKVFDHVAPIEHRPERWALCYDELEISPGWLRREILASNRSIDQRFLLKATFSPLLPDGLVSDPESRQDFERIRLWHSHIEDARSFCEDVSERFLTRRFPDMPVDPSSFFGRSNLTENETSPQAARSYERDGPLYRMMKTLAETDRGFQRELRRRGIDADDPFSEDPEVRDEFFRKVRPIVVLRAALTRGGRGRSRKLVLDYSGKDVIYGMSEGNPRWLLGILSDLYNAWESQGGRGAQRPHVSRRVQSRVLRSVSHQFHSSMGAVALRRSRSEHSPRVNLLQLLDLVGQAIGDGMLGEAFPSDPYASFIVDADASAELENLIRIALEKGAVVFVGESPDDVPTSIRGSRFRLSFVLSPVYHLPVRNYRPVLLSSLLTRAAPVDQLDLFGSARNRESDS